MVFFSVSMAPKGGGAVVLKSNMILSVFCFFFWLLFISLGVGCYFSRPVKASILAYHIIFF